MADELLTPSDPNGATIIWLHGGALMLGSPTDQVRHNVRRYVEAGYTVLCLDYPLFPAARLDQIVAFTAAACGRIRSPFALVGHSAGAYLAFAATERLDRKPEAIVSFYGFASLRWGFAPAYTDLPAANPDEGGVQFYRWCRQNGRWMQEVTGKDPEHNSQWIESYEPVLRPGQAVPTLLLHGDADADVPVEESRKIAAALDGAGIDHAYIEIPGGGHGFDVEDPGSVFGRVLEFLKDRLP